jgi:hypothetical protein
MGQMTQLLVLQTCEPRLRFGELAVREGFCTDEDVQEALRLQRGASPHALEVFLAEVPCDHERVLKVLVQYIRHLEGQITDAPRPTEEDQEVRRTEF